MGIEKIAKKQRPFSHNNTLNKVLKYTLNGTKNAFGNIHWFIMNLKALTNHLWFWYIRKCNFLNKFITNILQNLFLNIELWYKKDITEWVLLKKLILKYNLYTLQIYLNLILFTSLIYSYSSHKKYFIVFFFFTTTYNMRKSNVHT